MGQGRRARRPRPYAGSIHRLILGQFTPIPWFRDLLIVKIILSLCVLLLTYDAICGEKEAGTLRLYASFPLTRSTLALTKFVGSTVAVLIPFIFSYLLASIVLALSPKLGLSGEDWVRVIVLMGIFSLYLTAFIAFGLWISALTHRRMTAFLGLLGLWTIWIFIVPDFAVSVAQRLRPVESIYKTEKESYALRGEIRKQGQEDIENYQKRTFAKDWKALSEARLQELRDGGKKIQEKWNTEFYARLKDLQTNRRNQIQRQQGWITTLSAVSPLNAVGFVSMDLARTGPVQQKRLEDALNAYLTYMTQFIHEKRAQPSQKLVLTDFSWFTYQDNGTTAE